MNTTLHGILLVYPLTPASLHWQTSCSMAAARPACFRLSTHRLHRPRIAGAHAQSHIPRILLRALATVPSTSLFDPLDTFANRHIGPNDNEVQRMLSALGYESMDAFIAASVPPSIRLPESAISNSVIPSFSESQLYKRAKALAAKNKPFKSYIGMGYHNAVVPPVILRNVRTPKIDNIDLG